MKTRSIRRTVTLAVLAVVVLLLGGGWLYVRAQMPMLVIGTGYAARIGCGCRFISSRPLASCRADMPPGTEMISLSEDAARQSVTASVPLLISRTSRLDPVLGCQLPPR